MDGSMHDQSLQSNGRKSGKGDILKVGGEEDFSGTMEDELRTRGGWRTMPFTMGNELCNGLVDTGVNLNMMSFLTKKYNMRHVTGAAVLNVSFGTTCMTPLLVAYLSDAYLGRFWAVICSCLSNILGSLFLTISA
eukprot:c6533_g1_i1 orf=1-402(-)